MAKARGKKEEEEKVWGGERGREKVRVRRVFFFLFFPLYTHSTSFYALLFLHRQRRHSEKQKHASSCPHVFSNPRKSKKRKTRLSRFSSHKRHFFVSFQNSEKLLLQGLEVRPRLRAPRLPCQGPFRERHLLQARAPLDQIVKRGVDLLVVVRQIEELERLQLADKPRDGAEAAAGEVEKQQMDFMFPSSARNATSWDIFPRFMLPPRSRLISLGSSLSSLGQRERRSQSMAGALRVFSETKAWPEPPRSACDRPARSAEAP